MVDTSCKEEGRKFGTASGRSPTGRATKTQGEGGVQLSREEVGRSERERSAGFVCRKGAVVTFSQGGRWRSGWIPGWNLAEAGRLTCCTACTSGLDGQGEGRGHRLDEEEGEPESLTGVEEEEVKCGFSAGSGSRSPAGTCREEGEKEPRKEPQQAPEKEPRATPTQVEQSQEQLEGQQLWLRIASLHR